jgi:hypothetical protein
MSELETLVNYDMYKLGYDSSLVSDIKAYWESLLS